ncbi:DUF5615 family PIN-like protein [Halorubrum ezzemoulense]|jgi:hypothetical protein|uniref:DUF5615 domain-containing protein n=1 Tax=Halorubrum ezzemoulense TaxID=337243 RepID=A0A256KY56_HALEZ|nr:DUF5615 family PIN-like protein [Halorubrum ezzemoulense]MDB2265463.1 DUF5615 family PIN-like protein [Halorubrum ezzemoulense]OYR86104.1 hypothetical protein DJ84_00910 [Halorubrum ezzemoulense]QAY19117.1 hypothetical protein EO776_03515 [Halorubrum ezzemoulense]
MRLLCDQNVAQRYIDACIEAPDIQAITVRDALDPRANDPDIATYAGEHGYVVLTTDDDFFTLSDMCGCIYFHQLDRPPVGDVLTAIRQIGDAYGTHDAIVEVVPGGWV